MTDLLRNGKEMERWTKEQALTAYSAVRAISDASKTVSRVLYLTVIYLDAPLPMRSSHLLEAVGQTCCFPTVLLRIEFTATDCLQPSGELLPRLSILTFFCQSTEADNSAFRPRAVLADAARPPWNGKRRRYISVALFLKSPSAGVTRYPCPVEPGLSS